MVRVGQDTVVSRPRFLVPRRRVNVPRYAICVNRGHVRPRSAKHRLDPSLHRCQIMDGDSQRGVRTRIWSPTTLRRVLSFLVAFNAPRDFIRVRGSRLKGPRAGYANCLATGRLNCRHFHPVTYPARLRSVFGLIVDFHRYQRQSTFPGERSVAHRVLYSWFRRVPIV